MTARALAVLALGFVFGGRAEADLLDYVKRPEPAARWEKRSDRVSDGVRIIEVELVSQVWQDAPWRHRLRLSLPSRPSESDLAVLVVTGGSRSWIEDEKTFVASTGVPLAVLGDVPNQPLFRRHEDALIAYTFEQYLRSPSDDWPLLFPMTKAAVRAMDAVAEIARQETGKAIGRFVVSGASKRGWTSWLAAVADPRVAGIAPMVFDNLNFARQMKNQLAVWGAYSPELGDYSERGLQALIETERGQKLVSMVDPAAYRDSLARIPKLVVSGSNDPYWELDAVNLYWSDLGGAKSLLVVPNAGHDAPSDARTEKTLPAFVRRIVERRPMPELRLEAVEPPRVSIVSNEPSASVRVWRAESPTRDFREARWT
ncbi:MAG: PhoPQ-activated protein PqaA family protein, partial [Candidatus Binatia bacterium]